MGAKESLNGGKNMARRKVRSAPGSPRMTSRETYLYILINFPYTITSLSHELSWKGLLKLKNTEDSENNFPQHLIKPVIGKPKITENSRSIFTSSDQQ